MRSTRANPDRRPSVSPVRSVAGELDATAGEPAADGSAAQQSGLGQARLSPRVTPSRRSRERSEDSAGVSESKGRPVEADRRGGGVATPRGVRSRASAAESDDDDFAEERPAERRPRGRSRERAQPTVSVLLPEDYGSRATGLSSVFSVETAPVLNSLRRASVVEFLRRWEQYVRKTSGAGVGRVRLRDAVNPSFLSVCCSMRKELGEYSPDNVPDEVLMRFLKGDEGLTREGDEPSIDEIEAEIRRRVRFDTGSVEHRHRFPVMYAQVLEVARSNGWQRAFGPKRKEKEVVQFLTSLLQPERFRARIKNEVKYGDVRTVDDLDRLVSEQGAFLDGLLQGQSRSEPERSRPWQPSGAGAGFSPERSRPWQPSGAGAGVSFSASHARGRGGAWPSAGRRAGGTSTGGGSAVATQGSRGGSYAPRMGSNSTPFGGRSPFVKPRAGARDESAVSRTSSDRPSRGCFKCGGPHGVTACPSATKDEVSKLLGRRSFHKSRSGSARARKALVQNADPSHGVARFPGGMEAPLCFDTGATRSIMSRRLADRVDTSTGFAAMRRLDAPRTVTGVKSETEVVDVLTTDLFVRGVRGQRMLRQVEFNVCDGFIDEVLVGEDQLSRFGVDIAAWMLAEPSGPGIMRKQTDSELFGMIEADAGRGDERFEAPSRSSDLGSALVRGIDGVRGVRKSGDGRVGDAETSTDESAVEGVGARLESFRVFRVVASESIVDDDEGDYAEACVPDVGVDVEDEVFEALEGKLREAQENGLSERHTARLRRLVFKYGDIWRIRLGADPPIKWPPVRVTLKPDAVPSQARRRKYSAEASLFMRKFADELRACGFIESVANPVSTSPVHVVRKPAATSDTPLLKRYRLAVDCRVANAGVVPIAWPMPDMDAMVRMFAGKSCFSVYDLCDGYWQLALHPDSRDWYCVVTDVEVFRPTRVLQGSTDGGKAFQAAMTSIFRDMLFKNLAVWLDDIALAASDEDELFRVLERFYGLCDEFGIKLSVPKSTFFKREVKWCGRLIGAAGVRFDPRRIDALKAMAPPTTVADLLQFLAAVNWMRQAIPDHDYLVAPLVELQNAVIARTDAKSRSKVTTRRLKLGDEWTAVHDACFRDVVQALANMVTLSHIDDAKKICVFTDASDEFWSALITQVPVDEFEVPFASQAHQLLACSSGRFKGAQCNWSVAEKEAFAILKACVGNQHITRRPGKFHVFTDHRNLEFIFGAGSTKPALAKHVASKLERWALQLLSFNFDICHIEGVKNVWADMLSRWAAPITGRAPSAVAAAGASADVAVSSVEQSEAVAVRVVREPGAGAGVAAGSGGAAGAGAVADAGSVAGGDGVAGGVESKAVDAEVSDGLAGLTQVESEELREFLHAIEAPKSRILPSVREIKMAQGKYLRSGGALPKQPGPLTVSKSVDGVWRDDSGRMWIPDNRDALRTRLLVTAHQAVAGHRGVNATAHILLRYVVWTGLRSDVRKTCASCLHCLPTRGGHRVPRPWLSAVHASSCNELLHFDFMELERLYTARAAGAGEPKQAFILVLKDDFSGFVELVPADAETADVVVQALREWFARFGVVRWWASDRGSHFTAKVLKEFARRLDCHHRFHVAYSPWANGTVERVNREVLATMRALMSQFGIAAENWRDMLPSVNAVLNATPSRRLGMKTPMEVFLGRPPLSVFDLVLSDELLQAKLGDRPPAPQVFVEHVARLSAALEQMHRELPGRPSNAKANEKRAGLREVNFDVGDYVLVAVAGSRPRSKLAVRWTGPMRVTKIVTKFRRVFEVEDLVQEGRTMTVHADRLRRYADSGLKVSEDLLAVVARHGSEYDVKGIVGHRVHSKVYQLRVAWAGYDGLDDGQTWEPLSSLAVDAPDAVKAYLGALPPSSLRDKMKAYVASLS